MATRLDVDGERGWRSSVKRCSAPGKNLFWVGSSGEGDRRCPNPSKPPRGIGGIGAAGIDVEVSVAVVVEPAEALLRVGGGGGGEGVFRWRWPGGNGVGRNGWVLGWGKPSLNKVSFLYANSVIKNKEKTLGPAIVALKIKTGCL